MDHRLVLQGLAFLDALGVGTALGLLYDLLRVGRERLGRAAGVLLDLFFWLAAAAALFLFAILRGDGQVRLYQGAAFLLGGVLWFATLSPSALWILRKLADALAVLRRILLSPFRRAARRTKKFWKKIKKDFQIWLEWYKINVLYHTDDLSGRGAGERHEAETGRTGHKVRHSGHARGVRDGVFDPQFPPD